MGVIAAGLAGIGYPCWIESGFADIVVRCQAGWSARTERQADHGGDEDGELNCSEHLPYHAVSYTMTTAAGAKFFQHKVRMRSLTMTFPAAFDRFMLAGVTFNTEQG